MPYLTLRFQTLLPQEAKNTLTTLLTFNGYRSPAHFDGRLDIVGVSCIFGKIQAGTYGRLAGSLLSSSLKTGFPMVDAYKMLFTGSQA